MPENRLEITNSMYNRFKNVTFGERLAICRTLQGKSQMEIAIEILLQRHYKGFESLDKNTLSICTGLYKKNIHLNSFLKSKNTQNDFDKANYFKAFRKIESMRCKYKSWEQKNSIDIDFSLQNLEVLTSIYNCDYSFLLDDEIYPHRTTRQIAESTGLSPHTIEKLTELTKKANHKERNVYSYMLSAINVVISDDDLLNIIYRSFHVDFKDSNITSLYPVRPEIIGFTYLKKIQYCLQSLQLRSRKEENNNKCPVFISNNSTYCKHSASFGENLRKLIKTYKYTYTRLADEMFEYENNHGYNPPQPQSILRTINNWIKKTKINEDYRINLRDLKAICNVLNCDYEYLFGNCQTFVVPLQNFSHTIGLSENSINALKEYNKIDNTAFEDMKFTFQDSYRLSIIDSLFTSDELLLYLTIYLTNIDLEILTNELEDNFFDSSTIKEYYKFCSYLETENITCLPITDLTDSYWLYEIIMKLDHISDEYKDYYLHLTLSDVEKIVKECKNGKHKKER